MIDDILVYIGLVFVFLGGIADIIASLGMNRFKNFYLRLHAATIGTIWGAFVPVIGVSLISIGVEELGVYRFFLAGGGFITAFLILILGPAGSHALARGTHRSGLVKVEPCIYDALKPELCLRGEKK